MCLGWQQQEGAGRGAPPSEQACHPAAPLPCPTPASSPTGSGSPLLPGPACGQLSFPRVFSALHPSPSASLSPSLLSRKGYERSLVKSLSLSCRKDEKGLPHPSSTSFLLPPKQRSGLTTEMTSYRGPVIKPNITLLLASQALAVFGTAGVPSGLHLPRGCSCLHRLLLMHISQGCPQDHLCLHPTSRSPHPVLRLSMSPIC